MSLGETVPAGGVVSITAPGTTAGSSRKSTSPITKPAAPRAKAAPSPESPLTSEQQRGVVDACAASLLTSHGLRTLAPDEPAYQGRYDGDPFQRDSAYHQGTVWAWLIGPFVLAHLRVYQDPIAARRMLEPFGDHLCSAGLGTISEIFDGDAPFAAKGCIAQAWSVAEVLRAMEIVEQARGANDA